MEFVLELKCISWFSFFQSFLIFFLKLILHFVQKHKIGRDVSLLAEVRLPQKQTFWLWRRLIGGMLFGSPREGGKDGEGRGRNRIGQRETLICEAFPILTSADPT